MSHLTREEKKKKILNNAQNRLRKLQNIKAVEKEPLNFDANCSEDNRIYFSDDFDVNNEKSVDNINSAEPPTSEKERNNLNTATKDEVKYNDDHSTDTMIGNVLEGETIVTSEKPVNISDSIFANKYRFCLFVLLGWVIFLVIVRDFDGLLAYLIGRQLPKENLPVLVWTTFIAVEVQIVLLQFCVGRKAEQVYGILQIALTLLRVPQRVLTLLMDMAPLLSSFVSDLCVYIFTIVMLTYFNESKMIR